MNHKVRTEKPEITIGIGEDGKVLCVVLFPNRKDLVLTGEVENITTLGITVSEKFSKHGFTECALTNLYSSAPEPCDRLDIRTLRKFFLEILKYPQGDQIVQVE